MKLPRWLVICLLSSSVLAVLAAAGWWWLTWPERTVRAYVDLRAAGQTEAANKMLERNGSPNIDEIILLSRAHGVRSIWSQDSLEPETRTVLDVLRGRQRFKLAETGSAFTAERGTLTEARPAFWFDLVTLEESESFLSDLTGLPLAAPEPQSQDAPTP